MVKGGWDRTVYYSDYYEFNVLTSTWTKLSIEVPQLGQHSMVVYNGLCWERVIIYN
jgi:hypothetical protein